ncbi:hypothetical protein CAPN002_24030 [Capnocytophaga stomatis]|uniref:hypothetical protein n=1 Tax=Capnocytophaga stomatis TaxID=1848904 RepID=UPI0019520550|nr:hypothetical protein [Capnocytophaga stomatis]GIJ95185.1 hypothetical protein CAPN002_24030 [Capnocytophaga stomatis]
MTISDLLTLIGILFAILAFISERNREYIVLKLSKKELIVIALSFLYVHFLLSFQWWANRFEFLKYFQIKGFPTPNAWAYLLSVFVLFYSIWKIFFAQFPLSSKEKLLSYYRKLLIRNDFAFLAQLVEKYHLHQVIEFLREKKTIKIENETGLWQFDHQEYLKAEKKVIKGRKLVYGEIIYYGIILNDSFLDNVANYNPYLFSQIIQELSEQSLKNDDFVNRYLKVLMTSKNGNFFREVRNNQNLGEFNTYFLSEERPILYALFKDIRVCSINEAWRGIGEPAILEIQEEAKKEYSVLRESEKEQDSDTIWSFRITIAIWYFDIMVREAIRQGVDKHMWMFYYYHFVSAIISNMEELPFENSDVNRKSRNFELIEDIFSKMMDWKNVIINSKNNNLAKSVYDCIGQCIYEVATTHKLTEEDKNYLINWIWEDLIKSFSEDNRSREIVDEIIDFGFEMFKHPSILFTTDPRFIKDDSKMYLSALEILWDKRDQPKLTGAIMERATRFKTEVIDNLLLTK